MHKVTFSEIFVGGYYTAVLNDITLTTTDVAPYPNWYKQKIPVKIIGEYPLYYVCEVQEHFNPNHGLAPSSPYRVTIDKVWIKNSIMDLY